MPDTEKGKSMWETQRNMAISAIPPVFKHSEDIFFNCIGDFHGICRKLADQPGVDCNCLKAHTERIISLLKEDERMLISLANAPYTFVQRRLNNSEISEMVTIHGVNVMIYALKISKYIGVTEARLPYIGITALTNHLGLLDLTDRKAQSELNVDSLREYQKQNRKYISRMKIDDFHLESIEQLSTVVKEEEEALSMTRLRSGIYQNAMIIQLCNEFEVLTHQKTYAPINAMKKLRDDMDSFFHPDIIKLFFNQLSIYPLGSFVKLSSQETAKVVKINENFIMRPEVIIVLDEEGREKEEPVRINLREKFNIYIKHAVVDETLTEHFLYLF